MPLPLMLLLLFVVVVAVPVVVAVVVVGFVVYVPMDSSSFGPKLLNSGHHLRDPLMLCSRDCGTCRGPAARDCTRAEDCRRCNGDRRRGDTGTDPARGPYP